MATATKRRGATPARVESKKVHRDTIGARIQKVRYQLGLTQEQVSLPTGRGRSAVAQWERDDCEPPLDAILELAKVLETTPQYLAFGLTGEPQVIAPDPATLGYALVSEVDYGEAINAAREVAKWGIPFNWLKSEAQVSDVNALMIFKCEYAVGPYEFGDRLLIDMKATRVSPPGYFLHWDGFGPVISQITPMHAGGKPVVKITGNGEPYEATVDQLHVIGRVRAIWRKG